MDRASGSGPEGRGFKSLRAHCLFPVGTQHCRVPTVLFSVGTRHCRVPTALFPVGTRHCRVPLSKEMGLNMVRSKKLCSDIGIHQSIRAQNP